MIPTNLKETIANALLKKERVLLGLDGHAGAGKSRLAIDLLDTFGGSIIHLDHFYRSIRDRDRSDAPAFATHMDLTRLKHEVLLPLADSNDRRKEVQEVQYAVFNCQVQSFTESRTVTPNGLIVLEGSYALHPDLLDFYDLTVFLEIDENEQERRLRQREGDYFDTFQQEWLPRETAYHEGLDPRAKADYVLEAADLADTVLYLVRHGVTESNVSKMIQGHIDSELSEAGRMQAKKLALRVADYRFDRAYTSDLKRAAETAALVLASHEVPLVETPLLREINMGEMEGLLYKDCFVRYKKTFDALKDTPLEVITPGGETGADVLARATSFVQDVLAAHPGEVLVAFSHGFILNLLTQSFAKDAGVSLPPTVFANTSLTKLIFRDGLLRDIPLINDASHLEPETPAPYVP